MRKISFLLLFGTIIVLPFCTTSKNAAGHNKKAAVTYAYDADIAPILLAHCTPCHYPEQGGKKLPLGNFTAVHDHIDDLLTRVQLPADNIKFMPFKNKKEPLTDSLIMVIKMWKEGGMMETKH